MTVLFTDPLFEQHHTGPHPENAGRLRAILQRLDQTGLAQRCNRGTFQPLTETQVSRVHEPRVARLAQQVAEQGGGFLDPDTIVSPHSYDVALAAAGACVAAVDAVLTTNDRTALCLVRPPGHHATPQRSMGFCLFNNIALAACHSKDVHGLARVLIVDWDVHHGNGTQDIFYENAAVHFLSIHRYGGGFYPGTGAADETGTGLGLGCTRNVPVRYGTSRKDYLGMFRNALEKIADDSKPELVLISAGFDAHAEDPIGALGLEAEDFAALTRMTADVAKTHAHGRMVSCLEGGYHPQRLAESVEAHLRALQVLDEHRT